MIKNMWLSNIFQFERQIRACRPIFGSASKVGNLVLRLSYATVLAAAITGWRAGAAPKDTETTNSLLSEGFTFPQSTVAGLLDMIRTGQTWDPTDQWMAYHNLERFHPYSERVSNNVLDMMLDATKERNLHVEMERLLLHFYDNRPRSLAAISKLQEIMRLLEASEAKRITAAISTKFSQTRAEAVACLHSLLIEFSTQPTLQILTAFNLLQANEHILAAENILINSLRNSSHAGTVFLFASTSFETEVSDRLIFEMQNSLAQLQAYDSRLAERRLALILEKRRTQSESLGALRCEDVLRNVIPISNAQIH